MVIDVLGAAGLVAAADGPLPVGDVIAGFIIGGYVAWEIYQSIRRSDVLVTKAVPYSMQVNNDVLPTSGTRISVDRRVYSTPRDFVDGVNYSARSVAVAHDTRVLSAPKASASNESEKTPRFVVSQESGKAIADLFFGIRLLRCNDPDVQHLYEMAKKV